MICCAVLCYAMLCYAMLCCAVLRGTPVACMTGGQGEGGWAGSEPPHGPHYEGGHDQVTGHHSPPLTCVTSAPNLCYSRP